MSKLPEILALIEDRLHPRAEIVEHHAAGIIAINKGAGLLTHPNGPKPRENESPAWMDAPYSMDDEAFTLGEHRVFLCNRLDSATSGIFILCTDAALTAIVKEQWSKQAVTKIYLAILRGGPSRPFEKWTDTLRRGGAGNEKGVRMQARAGAGNSGGQVAKTIVRRVHQMASNPKMTLVAMEPLTGRTHQLRAQAQLHHCPILGDAKYGDFRFNKAVVDKAKGAKGRLFLHSHVTRLKCRFEGEWITFTAKAPIPESFANLLRGNFVKSAEKTVEAILAQG